MEKERQMLLRHFQDLSRAASQRGRPFFTDFLNLDELSLLQEHSRELAGFFKLFGGRDACERQIACFLPEKSWMSEEGLSGCQGISWPISCIYVALTGARFSDAAPAHRDYLGAILGLGVDRSKIGDIIVEDKGAYFFCISNIASFLLDELVQVGRQYVCCEQAHVSDLPVEVRQEERTGTVSSCRLDAIVGIAFHTSRGLSQQLIETGRVYVNARQTLVTHHQPREGDVISVRGYGKFVYEGIRGQSKKGRIQIRIAKYC